MFWAHSLIRLAAAFVIGGVIGLERKRHGRSAGIRTHMIVCIGATLAVLVSLYVAEQTAGFSTDVLRLPAQIISGIGFLGAGMILLRRETVIGLTTAAGIWTTAIIGIALGFGFYLGAIIASALVLITNTVVAHIEKQEISFVIYYAEIDDITKTNAIMDAVCAGGRGVVSCKTVPAKSGITGNLGIEIKTENISEEEIHKVSEIEHVVFISRE